MLTYRITSFNFEIGEHEKTWIPFWKGACKKEIPLER